MGMPIVVDVRDDVDDAALDRVFDWLRFVDATFSTYKDDSEISRINRGELALEDAHPTCARCSTRCEELRHETNGYFDVRAAAADAIDPSGLVKGWSVDRAAAILDAAGLRNYAVNAGGDMRRPRRRAPGRLLARRHPAPARAGKVAAVVEANDLAVATSGATRAATTSSTRTPAVRRRASSR